MGSPAVTIDLPRTSAFAALLIVIAGYALVFRPLEAQIGERYVEIDAVRVALEHSLTMAGRIPTLERERIGLEMQLRRVHLGDRRAATVDRFLRTVAGISARDDVAVESVAAGFRPPPAATAGAAQAPLLEELPLEMTLRGQYRDVIRAARDLNDADAAARITLASLGNADRRHDALPQLNAAFHVTLLREADDQTPRVPHTL
jgi:hypothetical protein